MVLQYEHGFLLCLSTLISLAFYGANVNKVGSVVVDVIQPNEFVGLIVGAIFLTSF
jgi:inorganic pyrophosphatase